MGHKALNDYNKKCMKSEMNSNYNFEWEDSDLLAELTKEIKPIYPSSSDPEDFLKDRESLNSINDLFKGLFERTINNKNFIKDLKSILEFITKKYPDLAYNYRYRFETYENIIKKSNRLIINGCAGIGKSYFVNKLEEKLNEIKVLHLCVYGKYCKEIPTDVFDEIKAIKEEFYLVIDALNEFDEIEQENILNQIDNLKSKANLNIIITYRNNSLKDINLNKLEKIILNKYEFKGVDFESSLLMMIEMYGIESIKYLDVIESNNPLYLKMLNKILSSNKLKLESINGLVQITFIMESYIKEMCGLDNWNFVKTIGKHMLCTEKPYITEDDLKTITKTNYNDFAKKITESNFMFFNEYDSEKRYWFRIQQLADYIISRPLFDEIANKSENDIIEIINKKICKIYTLHEAITIVLFEKYKERDLQLALRIFMKSELNKEVNLSIFRKINFTKEQINCIQNFFEIEMNPALYNMLGGFPNRPFNCTNFINNILLTSEEYNLDLVEKYAEGDYILHLKNIVYSIPFLNEQDDFVEEYFNYAFWLMSSTNERIRNLSIKIVYDLTYKNLKLRILLIDCYKKVKDYYIKKGIIHIITKLPKDKFTIKFIKSIFKNKKELDAENICRASKYLNNENEIAIIHKLNLYTKLPKKIEVDEELNLSRIISTADIHEKYLLKFERYPKEINTLSLYENFILNNSKSIAKYNKKLKRKFGCVKDDGYCKYSIGGSFIKEKMNKLNIQEIDLKRMFLIYQEVFKYICSLYNYDCNKLERFDIHINKFENSLLKKILLISQDLLLGSLMTNYYTEEFSVYNDDITFGFKTYSYITYNEEKIYLTTPISPYNEIIDKLNMIKCDDIDLYKERNDEWYKNTKLSINVCSKLTESIKYNGEKWSMIGGSVQRFIPNEINESYSCYMVFNPKKNLVGDEDSRYLTIENETYFDSLDEYNYVDYDKNMRIQNFQSNSKDIKESNLSFPPPKLIKYLGLKYDFKTSSWIDKKGNAIIICDNNQKNYYKYPISGAIYIKTSVLEELKKTNTIIYWCYTEKLFKNYGFNEEASLHLELDETGQPVKIFNNNRLSSKCRMHNLNCNKCKYNIYQKSNDSLKQELKIIDGLLDEIENDVEN